MQSPKADPVAISAAESPEVPTEIETGRLTLRAPREGESAEINRAVRESIDDLRRWMQWAQLIPSLEESEEYSKRSREKFASRQELPMRAYLKGTQTFVAGTGFCRIDWSVPKLEIGYWVRRRFASQGFVTEAVRALTELAFDRLDARRVEIRTDEQNAPSRRVAERAGFTLEGILKNECREVANRLRNTCVYAIARGES